MEVWIVTYFNGSRERIWGAYSSLYEAEKSIELAGKYYSSHKDDFTIGVFIVDE